MRTTWRALAPLALGAIVALALGAPAGAHADETDNFTCRGRVAIDAQPVLDGWVNARIDGALARANGRGTLACDTACLVAELQREVGGSTPHPLTLIPHSRFERWLDGQRSIDRCHLAFGDTIYGARPYNQPWLFPFLGRTIFVSDSILLSGRIVGLDKINHFVREGLAHWRYVDRGTGDIAASVAREWGPPHRQFAWTEYGLKGLSLPGVLSYADVAAGYSGYRFWSRLLAIDAPDSYVVIDRRAGRYAQRRAFRFDEYVNDAWDEAINLSEFQAGLAREVEAALRARALSAPVIDCGHLAALPDARLYVNPSCLHGPPEGGHYD
jgi:hypothetical protein